MKPDWILRSDEIAAPVVDLVIAA
ncbi:MAG: hypothetical protein JWN27_3408, partial [Candidatus Eremiobacteraeota bacterium]|nr:hypothetical protein [Candidatus Eremiobacteraeota bacterium]